MYLHKQLGRSFEQLENNITFEMNYMKCFKGDRKILIIFERRTRLKPTSNNKLCTLETVKRTHQLESTFFNSKTNSSKA